MKVLILVLSIVCIAAQVPDYPPPPGGVAPPVAPPLAPTCVWNPPTISYPPCSKPCGGGLQVAFRTLVDGTDGANCKYYANKTIFVYNAGMKGFVDNASRECNTEKCPEKLACRSCNRTNLAEDGCVSSIVEGQQKGECICASGWKGPTCDIADADLCKTRACKNSGICQIYAANNTAYCKCIGSWKGADCSEDLCGTNCDKTGTATCYDDGVNGVLCTCKAGYFGQKCNQQTTAPDCSKAPLLNCNKATNQGTCVNNYGMSYCNCSAGFYGKACEISASGTNIPTTCKPMQAMECVMSITATKPCDVLSAYLSCADNATCPDMRTLWCQNLPAGAEACSGCADAVSKANTDWNCNQNLYSVCLAELKKDIHDGAVHGENTLPKVTGYCGASARLARCAANAWCPDLLSMYCRTQSGSQCADKVNVLPQECQYLKQ